MPKMMKSHFGLETSCESWGARSFALVLTRIAQWCNSICRREAGGRKLKSFLLSVSSPPSHFESVQLASFASRYFAPTILLTLSLFMQTLLPSGGDQGLEAHF